MAEQAPTPQPDNEEDLLLMVAEAEKYTAASSVDAEQQPTQELEPTPPTPEPTSAGPEPAAPIRHEAPSFTGRSNIEISDVTLEANSAMIANQNEVLTSVQPEQGVMAIFSGRGNELPSGAKNTREAAVVAADTIGTFYRTRERKPATIETAKKQMAEALSAARQAVQEDGHEGATTALVAKVEEIDGKPWLIWGNAGNAQLLVQNKSGSPIESMVTSQESNGVIQNGLAQEYDIWPREADEISAFPLGPDKRVVLCTKGLADGLSDAELQDIFHQQDPDDAAEALLGYRETDEDSAALVFDVYKTEAKAQESSSESEPPVEPTPDTGSPIDTNSTPPSLDSFDAPKNRKLSESIREYLERNNIPATSGNILKVRQNIGLEDDDIRKAWEETGREDAYTFHPTLSREDFDGKSIYMAAKDKILETKVGQALRSSNILQKAREKLQYDNSPEARQEAAATVAGAAAVANTARVESATAKEEITVSSAGSQARIDASRAYLQTKGFKVSPNNMRTVSKVLRDAKVRLGEPIEIPQEVLDSLKKSKK